MIVTCSVITGFFVHEDYIQLFFQMELWRVGNRPHYRKATAQIGII